MCRLLSEGYGNRSLSYCRKLDPDWSSCDCRVGGARGRSREPSWRGCAVDGSCRRELLTGAPTPAERWRWSVEIFASPRRRATSARASADPPPRATALDGGARARPRKLRARRLSRADPLRRSSEFGIPGQVSPRAGKAAVR